MSTCARCWRHARRSSQVVLLLLLLAVCAGWPLASLAQEPAGYSGGMSVFLEPGPGQWRDPDQQHIFQIASGTPLRATFGFDQSCPETKTFRVFFLLNYEQIADGYQEIPTPDWDASPSVTQSLLIARAHRLHAGRSSTPGTTSSSATANSPSRGDRSTGSLPASTRCTVTPRPLTTSITRCSGSTIQYSRTPPRA